MKDLYLRYKTKPNSEFLVEKYFSHQESDQHLRTIHNPTEALCCHPGQHWGLIRLPHTFGLKESSKYHWISLLLNEAIRDKTNRHLINSRSTDKIPHQSEICHLL